MAAALLDAEEDTVGEVLSVAPEADASGPLLSGASTLSPNSTTTKIAKTVRYRPMPVPFILETPV